MPVKPNDKWARENAWACHMADDIPTLRNYREALIHHNAVSPFSKGRNKGKKPLGHNRRYDRVLIRMSEKMDHSEDSFGHSIIVSQYNKDIVTYFPDGRLTLDSGTYDSISTTQIMQELLGLERIGRRKGKIYYFDGIGHAYRITNGLRICADGHVDINSVYMESRHVLNKEKMKAMRAKYKPFTDYAKMVIDITQGSKLLAKDIMSAIGMAVKSHHSARNPQYVLSCEVAPIQYNQRENGNVRNKFFNELDRAIEIADETKRLEAMLPLVEYVSFCAARYYDSRAEGNDVLYKWEMNNDRFKHFFTEVLKFHYGKELFTKELAPIGTITHDGNYKYIELSTQACLATK